MYIYSNETVYDIFGSNPIQREYDFYEKSKDLLRKELYLGLKHRPKKPDVFNNISINTPYYMDIKEKFAHFDKYEFEHHESLESFSPHNLFSHQQQQRYKYGWFKPLRYMYDNRYFDNALELELYIYAVDHDIDIIRHPDSDLKHIAPDFKFGDKYIYIIPKHFYKNGELIRPYDISVLYDSCRTIDDYNQEFRNDIKSLSDRYPNIEFWNEDNFEEISKYIYDNYSDDYLPLFIIGIPFPWANNDLHDVSPMGLVRHFHKSIFSARHKNEPTALEVWDNKDIFKKLAINRLFYVGECNLERMRQGLNITKIATKCSVFKSNIAVKLIQTYLYDAKNIFDCFSGFSGRMLGAILCGIPYIGRDINPVHVHESLELINWWKQHRNPNILVDLDIADATTNTGVYDCLFTCSPYATIDRYGNKINIETWDNPNQLALTCDEWIDICLMRYKCRKYLFVVDDTIQKYRPYVVDYIGNKGHMGRNIEMVVYLDFTNYSLKMNYMNNFKGITPFDYDKSLQYQPISEKGITPFDIPYKK